MTGTCQQCAKVKSVLVTIYPHGRAVQLCSLKCWAEYVEARKKARA